MPLAQIIIYGDGMARVQQFFRTDRTNIPGPAGDEYVHAADVILPAPRSSMAKTSYLGGPNWNHEIHEMRPPDHWTTGPQDLRQSEPACGLVVLWSCGPAFVYFVYFVVKIAILEHPSLLP